MDYLAAKLTALLAVSLIIALALVVRCFIDDEAEKLKRKKKW